MNRTQTAPRVHGRTRMWMYHNLNRSVVAGVPRVSLERREIRVSLRLAPGHPNFSERVSRTPMTREAPKSPPGGALAGSAKGLVVRTTLHGGAGRYRSASPHVSFLSRV
jgi:hypothetical protein